MAKKKNNVSYNSIESINEDWGLDERNGFPYSGESVQEFIKKSLNGKAGIFYYDTANNRYLVFANEQTRDEYLEDTTKTELIIGTFDAPFNYSAEIHLETPSYNAVFLDSVGNYIDFTFDVKNKQGASTGENVTVTYTFIRNSIKKVVRENRRFGESVHFNVDQFLGEGTNVVTIGIVGQSTLAATTVSVTYQVVNLEISDEMNISTVYDLSEGSKTLAVPFSVSGYGTKTVEWYLDGEKLPFVKAEDEIVDVSATRTKYITLSNLQQGRHSLQFRAYVVINGENFYTDTLYRDIIVYTGADSNLIFAVAATIPFAHGVLGSADTLSIYNMVQYIPYTLRFATYSPSNIANSQVVVKLGGETVATLGSNNGVENNVSIVSKTSGNKTLVLTSGEVSYSINVLVAETSMNLHEISLGLAFDFNAIGKSNNSSDRDHWTSGDYEATLEGFNWNNNSGWVNNRLEMNAGSSITFNYAPLAGAPTSTGKTIEIEWSTKNVIDDNAVICDLRGTDGTGILITATKVSLYSKGGVVIDTEYKSDENVRIGFVINKASGSTYQKLSFIYANGIISRCESWAVTDSYTSSKELKFTATSNAEISLKAVRVYDAALTPDEMLNNYILYRDNVDDMLAVYDRNDVYAKGSSTFDPERMVGRLPVMIVTGNIPVLENTSDKNTQIIVDIDYTNIQDPTKNFRMEGAAMRPQGTSSMGYPKKNFRIYTRKVDSTKVYDYEGKLIDNKLYAFKDGAQPVDCWCLKADYAESSGIHNTGIARLWNDALYNARVTYSFGDGDERNIVDKPVLRTNAQQIAADNGYPYDVRTTIDGFPILLFYRLSSQDELIFIGKYNFNNDKSTESVFGFTGIPGFNNEKMQCWEVLNNGNSLALFTTADGFDANWSDAFEARYPDKSTNVSDLKAFCTWMSGVSQEDFAVQKWEHLDVYKMAAYWIYLMRHAGADQFVKNAMFTSEDGVKWYYILYDNDTINGLINTGRIAINPTDGRQTVDATGSYVFAGHDSRLWNMLEADEEFNSIVSAVDNALYSAGISYIDTIKIFDDEQADKWVERVYNQDAQYKYIGPYVEKGINNLFMLQGKRDIHRKWWLAKRYSIFDAKYVSGTYKQGIELKCIYGTPKGQQFTIKAGMPLDYGYGINNVTRVSGISLNKGESHTFTTTEVLNIGDPIRIYGAPNIEELNLSEMSSRLTKVDISGAYNEALGTMLKKLVIGKAGVENLAEFEFSGLILAKKLEYLDIQGIKNIKFLDLSKQLNFKTLVANGSGISSVTFAKGAPVESISLPSTMTNLFFEQLPYLESSNISFESIRNVDAIVVKACPKVSNDFEFVYNWFRSKSVESANATLIMDNVDWKNVDADKLAEISEIGNLDLKGKVVLSSITIEQLNTLIEVFGESAFDKNSDFFINAPGAIFVTGRTELLEGESEDYGCVVFGGEVKKLTWSIYSGSSSYTSINTETGVLTTTEGMGNRTLTIRVTAITDSGTKVKDLAVNVKARVYPSSSQATISGSSKLESARTSYQLSFSVSGITGDMVATWTLSGMDGYAEIESYDNSSCVVKKLAEASTLVQGTLSCALKKRYNNSNLFTVTKTINIVNELVAETDTGIVTALYNAGLCANPTYITKEEAALVTADDLQPGTAYNSSIFYPQSSKIKSFDGFKYFTGVTYIKTYTFDNCSSLTSIEIPEGILSIDYGGFSGCRSLISINIPSSLTSLGRECFYYCSSLTSINLPEGLTSLGQSCFTYCSSLTSINLPEGLTTLGPSCFSGCSSLTSITLPSSFTSLRYLDNGCFSGCSSLTSVAIPEGLTSLGGSCFSNCTSLTSVTLPSTITALADFCFSNCTSLTSINIPEGLKSLGSSCFYQCTSLTSITLPMGLTTIGASCFSDCGGKLLINVTDGNTKFSSIDGVLFDFNKSTLIQYAKDKIQSVYEVPKGVVTLGAGCFSGCSSLTSITLPSTVNTLKDNCFSGCSSLTSINLPPTLTSLPYQGFYGCSSLTSINLPKGPTAIPSSCFQNCSSLTSIVIPDGFTNISTSGFQNCTSLTSVSLPEGLKTLGQSCFKRCTSLTSVTLPSSVDYLIDGCFSGCSSLTSIEIPEGVPYLQSNTFEDCSSLTSISLPSSINSLGKSCFSSCNSLTSINLPEGLTSLGEYCFQNCTSLTSVTLPSSITSIKMRCFASCNSLKSITCLRTTAPSLESAVFGSGTYNFTGRNTYNTGENTLYVPSGATGYDTGYWLDPLQNAEKCGFTLSATL